MDLDNYGLIIPTGAWIVRLILMGDGDAHHWYLKSRRQGHLNDVFKMLRIPAYGKPLPTMDPPVGFPHEWCGHHVWDTTNTREFDALPDNAYPNAIMGIIVGCSDRYLARFRKLAPYANVLIIPFLSELNHVM
jgi:hypothetical protein